MTPENDVSVYVDIATDSPGIPQAVSIEGWVTRAVRAAGRDEDRAVDVSVRVVDRDEMRTLNRDYRHRDGATNVLSFPAGEIAGLPSDARQTLGDIVACAPVIEQEAAQQGKAPGAHWAHMVIHGTLHLLGYEHGGISDAAEMEALEVAILAGLGIADPYTEQTDTIG